MTKEQLGQIKYLKSEIELLKGQLESIETTTVTDSVRGSSPFFPYIEHSIRIEGIDCSDYNRKAKRLERQLKRRLDELMDLTTEAYKYIDGIEDSITRQAIMLKYVNGLSWTQTAAHIGGGNTAEGLRKRVQRFFKEN